MGENYS